MFICKCLNISLTFEREFNWIWNFWLSFPHPHPSFRTLNALTHCLLPFKISDEKSADILIEDLFLWQFASFLLLSCCYSWWCPLGLLGSVCFSSVLFLYVPQTIILSSSSLTLLLFDPIYLWISLIRFLFHLLYYSSRFSCFF